MLLLNKIIVTVFGSGFFPKAPGTAGSFLAAIIFYLFHQFLDHDLVLGVSLVVIYLIAWVSINAMEKIWEHDDSRIVIDELIGLWVVMLFIPYTLLNLVLAFLLFRFFDILKPLGIRKIDQELNSAAGVILDDVLAGVYANLCLQAIVIFILPLIK